MTFEEYKEEGDVDLYIAKEPGVLKNALADRPYLHGKWMQYWRNEREKLRKVEFKLSQMRRDRWHHLKGDSPPETYKDDPVDFYLDPKKQRVKGTGSKMVTISMVEMHLDADPKYNAAIEELEKQKEIMQLIEDKLKMITYRTKDIELMLSAIKFEMGS